MSLKEDASQFDHFFKFLSGKKLGEKPTDPNQGGDDPWLDGMPEEVPETKAPTVEKRTWSWYWVGSPNRFLLFTGKKKERTQQTMVRHGVCFQMID